MALTVRLRPACAVALRNGSLAMGALVGQGRTPTYRGTPWCGVARSRAGARGGVVVEGLIVIAITCVFLGSGIGLYRACIAKLHAVRDARAATWTLAMRGCNGNGIATELSRDVLTLTEGSSSDSEIPVLSWMTSDDVFQQRSQTAKGPANREFVMTSKAIVTCNETPSRAGSDWAADTVRSLIGTAFAP
ncbi:MAG: hypothetical protein QM784_21485 [Polyangiaceae bacterium]